MNRTEWQAIAEERLLAAGTLLAATRWPTAYYVAGYAVECGLKSCVLAYVESTGVIFDDKKYSEKCWTHKLDDLVELSGLKPDLDANKAANHGFAANWDIVKDWTEISRYQMKDQAAAQALYDAIVDPVHVAMQWVKTNW